MLLRHVVSLVCRRLQQLQLNLQRSISQQARQLCLRIDLCRHQVQQQNVQRTDVLGHRPGIRHHEYVFLCQRIYRRKIFGT